jgi:hypothetical protein
VPVTVRRLLPIIALALGVVACGSNADDEPGGSVQDLTIDRVTPLALVPGSTLVVEGKFEDLDPAFVELHGNMNGAVVDAILPATQAGLGRLEVKWTGGYALGLPSDDGQFDGTLRVNASVPADPREHHSPALHVSLTIAEKLEPKLGAVFVGDAADANGVLRVNGPIHVEGNGFLLDPGEGTTVALLDGCFQKQGDATCTPLPEVSIPVTPPAIAGDPNQERTMGSFPFAPKIAGIEPGLFQGAIRLRNDHSVNGASTETQQIELTVQLLATSLDGFFPTSASLGQYVEISGGGFVGKWPSIGDATPQGTLVNLTGDFTPTGTTTPAPIDLQLVTEFVSGEKVLYVLNEEDALGQIADLRTVTGAFKGTATAVSSYGSQSVTSAPVPVKLGIEPVKQVVWLNWLPTYKGSLEHLGLRAADQKIRDRIVQVIEAAYEGVNLEVRTEEPFDYALYAQADFEGPDPNALGLLGYDNSPGKDVGNLRLNDKMGGVNAITREGNAPGYGGVFVDSLFGFSAHPGKWAASLGLADPSFDQVFDRFRPDRGGKPVLSNELPAVQTLGDGSVCPAPKSDRKRGIACAIWVLGSMIGTTAAHEIGHSLGLADPNGEEFHNPGDEPNRLMDAGGARTFKERAELGGEGPGVFCDEDFQYLRDILPSSAPFPIISRPTCY